jgi:GNAT superfamily N-acetyltransferase
VSATVDTAKSCAERMRALGVDGPFIGTTLVGNAMFGLRTRDGAVVLSDLWVSPSVRGRGLGEQLLGQLLVLADLHQVPVRLRPCSFDRRRGTGLTTARLRRWYGRYGFAARGDVWMVRAPQPLQPAEQRSPR